jgi:hypothetical protein
LDHPEEVMHMKANAAAAAASFHVDCVIPPLLEKMGLLPRTAESSGHSAEIDAGTVEQK